MEEACTGDWGLGTKKASRIFNRTVTNNSRWCFRRVTFPMFKFLMQFSVSDFYWLIPCFGPLKLLNYPTRGNDSIDSTVFILLYEASRYRILDNPHHLTAIHTILHTAMVGICLATSPSYSLISRQWAESLAFMGKTTSTAEIDGPRVHMT